MLLLSLCCAVLASALLELRTSAQQPGTDELIHEDLPSNRPREYRIVTPISTDAEGQFASTLLSASHKRRSPRDVSQIPANQLFYNLTVFGREFHVRLRPNNHLLAPGAVVEWLEDGSNDVDVNQVESGTDTPWKKEALQTNCAYVGDIPDIPGASVALSNCDGLEPVEAKMKILLCAHSL